MSHLIVLMSNVCPKAPPGMGHWDDQILGWVKWGTLSLIVIGGFVSIGTIILARVFAHPHGSRLGAMGLAITVLCAVMFVAVYAIVTGITGAGC
ncbi:hypothetical protein [Nocardioides terrisoli]|uniref:hypothetical protein n=1 Tax=Nocardioides terrisoli TaxID=3388267 RepID=UPI00287BB55D|nr:hypothetical protein [Nocardioides marmorisolisilvae]